MSKQKWYIIKNTNTCEYWDGSSNTDCWTHNINFAYFFYDKNDAIHTKDVSWDKDKFNDDCQVIELCEDDESYQELKEENKQLKQQLVEKDKEIEEYNKYFKSFGCKDFAEFQELIGLTKMSANDKVRDDMLRHQICEEIKIKGYYCHNGEEKYYKITPSMLWEIEKGE